MYVHNRRGGGGTAETSGVVSLVILVPVQPLLVELDNNLTSIVFFNTVKQKARQLHDICMAGDHISTCFLDDAKKETAESSYAHFLTWDLQIYRPSLIIMSLSDV